MASNSQVLVLDKGAPRRARAWTASVLCVVVPPDGVRRENIVEDVMLCISELVTDALLANSQSATIGLQIGPGIVRLSLTDAAILPASRQPGLNAQLMGWGMVRSLSQECGIDNYNTRRELWAVFRDARVRVVGTAPREGSGNGLFADSVRRAPQ